MRTTGISSYQTHKIIVQKDENGKIVSKRRMPRNLSDPNDVAMVGDSYHRLRREYGKKWYKEHVIRKSPLYRNKVTER